MTLGTAIRQGTSVLHREAERRPFMRTFFRRELPRDAYAEWLRRLSFVYASLEDVTQELRDDPVVGRMFSPELHRCPAMASDLTFYLGDGWETQPPSPVARDYAARVRECRGPLFVPHQWLRYLGMLSGGAILRDLVGRMYDDVGAEGLDFYDFPNVEDPVAYLRAYHERMDSMHLDEATIGSLVDEANRAFTFNIDLTDELARDFGIETPDGDPDADYEALLAAHR